MRGIRNAVAGVCLSLLMIQTAVTSAAPVPGTSCQVFPDDNVWNMDVSELPVHPNNYLWKTAMHAPSTNLHPDFGPPSYGMPFDVVGDAHATTQVRFGYADE